MDPICMAILFWTNLYRRGSYEGLFNATSYDISLKHCFLICIAFFWGRWLASWRLAVLISPGKGKLRSGYLDNIALRNGICLYGLHHNYAQRRTASFYLVISHWRFWAGFYPVVKWTWLGAGRGWWSWARKNGKKTSGSHFKHWRCNGWNSRS